MPSWSSCSLNEHVTFSRCFRPFKPTSQNGFKFSTGTRYTLPLLLSAARKVRSAARSLQPLRRAAFKNASQIVKPPRFGFVDVVERLRTVMQVHCRAQEFEPRHYNAAC